MSTRHPLARLFVVAAVVASAGAFAVTGCNRLGGGGAEEGGGSQVEVTRRVQRGVTPGQRTLVFDSYRGDVTLRDTTGPEAELTFRKHAQAGSRSEARRLLSGIRIEERGGGEEFAYQLTSSAPSRTKVRVRGTAPRDTRLRVHLRNSDAALSGLRGPLDVNDENGDIRIGGAARAVRAETRNGSVEAGLLHLPSEAEVRLRTANGDLRLTLPDSASADVEARTEAGDIDTGQLNFSERDLESSGAGARFEGTLGDGAAPVRLRTKNGDIALRRGTVRRLPDVGGSAAGDTTRAAQRDTTARDSAGRPGPLPSGTNRPSQQQQAPYTDEPPRLLRAPEQDGSGRDTSGETTDTSAAPSSGSEAPSPNADTTRRRR
ncbi:MAG: hypothetical protein BRD46_01225 [Bacteroidetes bacterium QS_8_68_15]|nr:MAG: hypothetical protein BRD46_01225 [Bacteroidetes bacterium QS_8_68_15]